MQCSWKYLGHQWYSNYLLRVHRSPTGRHLEWRWAWKGRFPSPINPWSGESIVITSHYKGFSYDLLKQRNLPLPWFQRKIGVEWFHIGSLPCCQARSVLWVCVGCWNDRGSDSPLFVRFDPSEDDVSSKLSAKSTIPGERQLGKPLKNGAFSTGLVSRNNKLGQVDVFTKVVG